jgi:phosphate transport system substrate-binding protein
LFLAILVLAAVLAGCGRSGATLIYSGATTLLPAVARAGEAFESLHPEVQVDVQGGGTTKGITDVVSGVADLGGAARELSAAELLLVEPIPVARDALAVIVNRAVPLTDLSLAELRAIFTAERAPAGLTRITKALGQGTAEAFAQGLGLTMDQIVGEASAGSNGEVIAAVQATGNAIGYVSAADALAAIAAGAPIRVITLNGVRPDRASVEDGRYPLVRALYLVLKRPGPKAPDGAAATARAFVDFLRSPAGTHLILDAGLVPAGG